MRGGVLAAAPGALILLAVLAALAEGAIPTPPGTLRISVEFRQVAAASERGIAGQGTGPGGSAVQVGPEGLTGSARVTIRESRQQSRRTSRTVLLVQEGGEGQIAVGEQLPEIAWYLGYAQRLSHVGPQVIFRQVGASFAVRPTPLPDGRIRVRIVPRLSYRSDAGGGLIELVEAATELVIPSGGQVAIGGQATDQEVVRRILLGYAETHRTGEVQILLTVEAP